MTLVTLEQDLHDTLVSGYKQALKECPGFKSPIFIQMLNDHGAVATCKKLINSKDLSSGYSDLWTRKRLDLTVEAFIVDNERFWALFTREEIDRARTRLTDCGFTVPDFTPSPEEATPSTSFDRLKIGSTYDRPQLAKMLGYQDFHAIGRGIVTPRDTDMIILFVTQTNQAALTQYANSLKDGILQMDGALGHGSDRRVIEASKDSDHFHLFFRERDHLPFTYYGEVFLFDYIEYVNQPSKFRFSLSHTEASTLSSFSVEDPTDSVFIPDEEGEKRYKWHLQRERSRKNRVRAIEIHGTTCWACQKNMNDVYGKELAQDYIEIHHRVPLADLEAHTPNPDTDLVPLCANCHRVIHRERGKVLPVEKLREVLQDRSTTRYSGPKNSDSLKGVM